MSGGIFIDRPFSPNIKCIIFALLMLFIYVYLPRGKNPLVMAIIFILAYISMAWYDYMYDCADFMYSASSGANPSALFKPQRRVKNRNTDPKDPENEVELNKKFKGFFREKNIHKARLVENQEEVYLKGVYLFHAIVIGPLLIYAGAKGVNAHPNTWGGLLGLGALSQLYHTGRYFYPRKTYV